MTLTEFLLARIGEDEAAAREATAGPWTTVIPHEWERPLDGELLVRTVAGRDYWDALVTPAGGEHGDDGLRGPDAEHIARHDPARVLAECEAKRRVVTIAIDQIRLADSPAVRWDNWRDMAKQTLAAIAAVYAVHPDYDEAWRP